MRKCQQWYKNLSSQDSWNRINNFQSLVNHSLQYVSVIILQGPSTKLVIEQATSSKATGTWSRYNATPRGTLRGCEASTIIPIIWMADMVGKVDNGEDTEMKEFSLSDVKLSKENLRSFSARFFFGLLSVFTKVFLLIASSIKYIWTLRLFILTMLKYISYPLSMKIPDQHIVLDEYLNKLFRPWNQRNKLAKQ